MAKPKQKMRRRAKRDVNLAFRPELREIDRAKEESRDTYEEADARIKDVYDTLQANLAPLSGQYDQAYQGIVGDLTGQLGGLSSMLGVTNAQSGAGAEGQAGMNAFGTLASGGLNLLASDRMRNVGYQTSTQRQGELERATLRKNYLEDFRDTIDELKNMRIDVQGDKKAALIQRLDELRDQRFSRNMQRRELSIAEEQFNKTFNLEKKGQNASRNFAQSQIDLERDRGERRGDRRRIAPIRQDIKGIRSELKDLKGSPVNTTTPQGIAEMEQRNEEMRRLEKQRTRKRKRIKRIRKRDNPSY